MRTRLALQRFTQFLRARTARQVAVQQVLDGLGQHVEFRDQSRRHERSAGQLAEQLDRDQRRRRPRPARRK